MTIYYTYRTENLLNGKYYLGKRSFRHKHVYRDSYLGSGSILRKEIVIYGKEHFKKEILNFYDTAEELNEAERLLVTREVIDDDMSYNIILGGTGFTTEEDYINLRKIMSYVTNQPEYKLKMSQVINSPEVKEKMITSIKRTMADQEWKLWFSAIQKEVQNRPEEKERNSKAQKIAQNRPDVKEKKSKIMKQLYSENLEVKSRHKDACNTNAFREAQRKDKLGTKFVNNGLEMKRVQQNDVEKYINNGWELGMLQNRRNGCKTTKNM